MFNFDNTLSVKNFAESKEAQSILNNIPKGSQTQSYKIGQNVSANGIDFATITDCYSQNGYIYYTITWTTGKIKKVVHTSNERQQDLQLLN